MLALSGLKMDPIAIEVLTAINSTTGSSDEKLVQLSLYKRTPYHFFATPQKEEKNPLYRSRENLSRTD
ncbi:hypothetical protein ACHWQZ_G008325 [Mnemiopsis leidyi]